MRDAKIDVRDVPAALRDAVEADARERDTSLNDTVCRVLSERYGLPWETSGYPYSGTTGDASQWLLRMPPRLRDTIRDHAKASGNTMRGVILLALELHYQLPTNSPRKRVTRIDPALVAEARERHASGESFRSIAADFRARGHVAKRETLAREVRAS